MGNINKISEDFPEFNKQWEDNYITTGSDGNIWIDKGALYDDWNKKLEELQRQQLQHPFVGNTKFELDSIVVRLEKIEFTLETLLSMMKLILSTQIETELRKKVEAKKETQEEVS